MSTTNANNPNIPLPAGAVTDGWTSYNHDGTLTRSLEWSSHDTANVSFSSASNDALELAAYLSTPVPVDSKQPHAVGRTDSYNPKSDIWG